MSEGVSGFSKKIEEAFKYHKPIKLPAVLAIH